MKKFHTKHGFTIVEVLVAFVIFAIMASMVSAILSTTMRAKQQNIELEEDIQGQQVAYYYDDNIDRTYKDPAPGETEKTLSFDFTGITDTPAVIKYNTIDPNTTTTDGGPVLTYPLGNVNYDFLFPETKKDPDDPDKEESEGKGESVTNRNMDSRLYGSTDVTNIWLYLVKDLDYVEGHRYFIAAYYETDYIEADTTIGDRMKYFATIKMNFASASKDSVGPKTHTITDCGYVKYNSLLNSFETVQGSWHSAAASNYIVELTSPYSIRLSGISNGADNSTAFQFGNVNGAGMYVTFADALPEYISGDATVTLSEKDTAIPKKSLNADYTIADGTGNFNIGEARQYLADLTNAKNTMPAGTVDYDAKLSNIDAQITAVKSALSGIQIPLNANRVFGYCDASITDYTTDTDDDGNDTGKGYYDTDGDNKYHFIVYHNDTDITKDDADNNVYTPKDNQPNVFGAFPIKKAADGGDTP